jgi:hypothetical protein
VDSAINNPFYGVQLGSIVTNSGAFGATVTSSGISRFDKQTSSKSSMSGTSTYVYSDHMNQGTFSVAGSYGLTGVAKVSAAVAGYVGNATARSGNSLEINASLTKWAGVEYIAFNDLGPAEFIAGLQQNVQRDAETVLDAYLAMIKDKNNQALIDAWVNASSEFNRRFGVGLAVGVLWGGWGSVSLRFTSSSSESKWEGGGNAKFSYVSDTAAVDIASTYGHSEDSIGKDASVTVDAFTNGACVEEVVSKWREDLQTRASSGLQALGKEPLISSSAMSGAVKPPPIPSFEKPSPSEGIAKKIGSIDSLDGLKAYAVASAYDKYKKDGGTDTLDQFLRSADTKNDVKKIPTGALSPLLDASDGDDDDLLRAGDLDDSRTPKIAPTAVVRASPGGSAPAQPADMSDYEPLGVWTVGWGQLFPWLVTGHDNRIKDDSFLDVIRLRTLQQDCRSLSGLYARLAGAGATLTVKGVQIDFVSIANAFGHAAPTIAEFLATKSPAEVKAGAKDEIKKVLSGLGPDAKAIYEAWDKVPALRQCELGAGIVVSTHLTGATRSAIGSITPIGQNYPTDTAGLMQLVPTSFDQTSGNLTAFSSTVKAWPVVLPDGRIVVFASNGVERQSGFLALFFSMMPDPSGAGFTPTMGLCTRESAQADDYTTAQNPDTPNHDVTVPKAEWTALVFNDTKSGYLNGYCNTFEKSTSGSIVDTHVGVVSIYPIPYSAAEGVNDWKGTSLTTGMGDLPAVLSALRVNLGALNEWTLDDASWAGVDWKSYRYSVQQLRPTYAGVVQEVKSVFYSTQNT